MPKSLKTLYHGTTITSANDILGPPKNISVDIQGKKRIKKSELGKGFYTTDIDAIARAWAFSKGGEGAVIRLDIDQGRFMKLDGKQLWNSPAVKKVWNNSLDPLPEHKNYDYLFGPFATGEMGIQYNFISDNAKQLLNSKSTRLTVMAIL